MTYLSFTLQRYLAPSVEKYTSHLRGHAASTASGGHRVRVAAQRRERMRMRLIESALLVFGQKGLDATDIQDVIDMAGVSRGSFYNYFRTNEELMGAVMLELANELLALIDPVVASRPDPAERVACGVRMVLKTARAYPLLARFATKVGSCMPIENNLAMMYLPRDILAGLDAGRFKTADVVAAMTLALGAAHGALSAMALKADLPERYPENIAFHVLMGLGVQADEAAHLVNKPLDCLPLPQDALLQRAKCHSVPF